MTTLRVTLGVRFVEITGEGSPVQIEIALPAPLGEIDPDWIFDAMQRVGILDETGMHATQDQHNQADQDRIILHRGDNTLSDVLVTLRLLLDVCKAPSMSVGDMIEYRSGAGKPVIKQVCEMSGWTTTIPLDTV